MTYYYASPENNFNLQLYLGLADRDDQHRAT